ncbi:MAG: molybdopterin-guanine dinucleotide biosynthesis protein B [Rhodopila sp.]|jgi:molybdopterin-guanine dinucleotide biosynthesis protein B
MRVLGIVGWSGSGKTSLLTSILPLLRRTGLRVSTVKHTHHDFDMDRPGKDSFRHREAGAHEVLIASGARWALLHELEGPEPALSDLLQKLDPVDLVLVEGYKTHPFPKLEVHRPSLGKPPIWTTMPDVIAVATDAELDVGNRAMLPLSEPEAVAVWVTAWISHFRANSP